MCAGLSAHALGAAQPPDSLFRCRPFWPISRTLPNGPLRPLECPFPLDSPCDDLRLPTYPTTPTYTRRKVCSNSGLRLALCDLPFPSACRLRHTAPASYTVTLQQTLLLPSKLHTRISSQSFSSNLLRLPIASFIKPRVPTSRWILEIGPNQGCRRSRTKTITLTEHTHTTGESLITTTNCPIPGLHLESPTTTTTGIPGHILRPRVSTCPSPNLIGGDSPAQLGRGGRRPVKVLFVTTTPPRIRTHRASTSLPLAI